MISRTRGVKCRRKQLIMLKGTDKRPPERVEIWTHNNRSIWDLLKEFNNSLDDETIFLRRDLLNAIYTQKVAEAMLSIETTVDTYRNLLCHAGYMERIGNGKYIKLHNIPIKATISNVKKHALKKDWED